MRHMPLRRPLGGSPAVAYPFQLAFEQRTPFVLGGAGIDRQSREGLACLRVLAVLSLLVRRYARLHSR